MVHRWRLAALGRSQKSAPGGPSGWPANSGSSSAGPSSSLTAAGAGQMLNPMQITEHEVQYQPAWNILAPPTPTHTTEREVQYQPAWNILAPPTPTHTTEREVQYQPAWNNPASFTPTALTELSYECQPAGNSSGLQPQAQYLPAEEGHAQPTIGDAQPTHPVSRDDDI